MSAADVADAGPTLDRIGTALDRIGGTPGMHPIAEGLAAYARERRGALRRVDTSRVSGHGLFTGQRIARDLLELADAAERLADLVAPA